MHDSPSTRRKLVVTMTRGDGAARRVGNPLRFENLGGAVVSETGKNSGKQRTGHKTGFGRGSR